MLPFVQASLMIVNNFLLTEVTTVMSGDIAQMAGGGEKTMESKLDWKK